jgi:hypothetical protein
MELYNLSPDPDKVYKDTELMLENYRNLVWRLEESVEDIKDKVYYMGGRHLSNLFHFISLDMSEYDNQRSKAAIEERLFSLNDSKIIVDAIDKAMLKLKSYPANGERYFQLLHAVYIDKEQLLQHEIQDKLLISNSTFYRYRKRAISLLGDILWRMDLQPFVLDKQSSLSEKKPCQEAEEAELE